MQELVIKAKELPPVCSEEIDKVIMTLQWCFAFLGIRAENLPDEAGRLVLLDYMTANIRNYSILDIKNAFTLYVQGKLDFHDGHFQNFSVLFLENVLQSYRRYVVNLPKKPAEKLPELPEPSPEEQEKRMIEGCIRLFDEYKATGEVNDYGNIYYDFLDRKKLIQLSYKAKWNTYHRAESELKNEAISMAMSYKGNDAVKSILNEIESNRGNIIVNRAKKIALAVVFDGLNSVEFNKIIANAASS